MVTCVKITTILIYEIKNWMSAFVSIDYTQSYNEYFCSACNPLI